MIQKVTSYIISLEGTNPPDAKAPEGDKWVPEEVNEEIETDSAALAAPEA